MTFGHPLSSFSPSPFFYASMHTLTHFTHSLPLSPLHVDEVKWTVPLRIWPSGESSTTQPFTPLPFTLSTSTTQPFMPLQLTPILHPSPSHPLPLLSPLPPSLSSLILFSLSSRADLDSLIDYCEQGVSEGARVVYGGRRI